MTLLGIACFVVLAVVVGGNVVVLFRNLRPRISSLGPVMRVSVVLGAVVTAVFILRPHDDSFAGLDNSGYRLMARAFQAGRPMHSVDRLLLEAPRELRNKFMLAPTMDERNTRDRSFLVKSLDTGETEPFFYPFLPLAALGFDSVVPGDALDYFVPVIGLLFVVMCLAVGAACGGAWGLLVAVALLAGSPLPAWLFRGFYVESVASILTSLSLLCWLTRPENGKVSLFVYLAAGLAISLHPAMMVVSLPLLVIFTMTPEERTGDVFAGLFAFGAGVAVMAAMTEFVCAPYATLKPSSIQVSFMASASQRITLACAAGLLALLVVGIVAKPFLVKAYQQMSETKQYALSLLPVVVSVALVLLISEFWSQREFVVRGIREAGGGVRFWLGFLLGICGVIVLAVRKNGYARMAMAAALVALPVFAYLKGAEQMGLWSQRRLLSVYLVGVVGLLPASAEWFDSMIRRISGPLKFPAATAVACLLLLAAAANPYRWPAPYTVRCDTGAWTWIEKVKARIGDRLVFFDYYPFSVPFAVDGKTRALGLCERAESGTEGIIGWLAGKALKEEVLLATAYENPGIEEGVALNEAFSESFRLRKITSKGALPAEKRYHQVDIKFLAIRPIMDSVQPPVLDKIFDGGPVAVRGRWGRGSPIAHAGRLLPARWSREGSGVIGPVPLPGGSVQICVSAAASRDDGVDGQVLMVKPPWTGNALPLAVSNDFSVVSGTLSRPGDQEDGGMRTGVYRIYASQPYDPAKAGISGYDKDLGARIHRIRIEAVSPAGSARR